MATVASFVATIVDNKLTNVSADACTPGLTIFTGDKAALSMTLDSPVRRIYSSVVVKYDDVIVPKERYSLYWLNSSLLVLKTLGADGAPSLPSKVEVVVDESVP